MTPNIHIRVFRYSLTLKKPIRYEKIFLRKKSGYLICVTDADGFTGWGDAALPDHMTLQKEKMFLAGCTKAEAKIRSKKKFPQNIEELRRFVSEIRDYLPNPSFLFAWETALLWLMAAKQKRPMADFLGNTNRHHISIQALLQGTESEILAKAAKRFKEGCDVFKLKIGGRHLAEEIKIISKLRRIIGTKCLLRLDANRKVSLTDAIRMGNAIKGYNIDFIEEPTRSPGDIGRFYDETGIPAALDETLRENPSMRILNQPGVKAFIIKPTFLGGYFTALSWAKRAVKLHKKVIVSSSYETFVGLLGLAHLALAMPGASQAAGLDTSDIFAKDILSPGDRERIVAKKGKYIRRTRSLPAHIELKNLSEITYASLR